MASLTFHKLTRLCNKVIEIPYPKDLSCKYSVDPITMNIIIVITEIHYVDSKRSMIDTSKDLRTYVYNVVSKKCFLRKGNLAYECELVEVFNELDYCLESGGQYEFRK